MTIGNDDYVCVMTRGQYSVTPYGPYGWLSSPPGVQRYPGMLWLSELLCPEYTEYDLQEEVTAYYKLFYGCDLSDELYPTRFPDRKRRCPWHQNSAAIWARSSRST